jgi:vancomycin resistance protein YoaR
VAGFPAVPRLRTVGFVALGTVGAVVLGVSVAYAIDLAGHDGEALRNVEVGGHLVGGLRRAEVRELVAGLDEQVARTEVRVRVGDGGFEATGAELGLTVDVDATVEAVMEAGRQGVWPAQAFRWAVSPLARQRAPLRVRVDQAAVARVVAERDPGPRTPPAGPSVALVDGELRAVPGTPGRGIDDADVAAALREADADAGRLTVEVVPGPIPPRFPDTVAEALAAEARRITADPLDVEIDGEVVTVKPATLRRWVTTVQTIERLDLAVNPELASEDLRTLAPDAGSEAKDATFQVVEGRLELVPATPGTRCCAHEMMGVVLAALRDRRDEPAALPLEPVEPERNDTEARALGITEEVATFTTRHNAGEARVTNIHRIADLVRGQIIEPGDTFSVNDFVGKRTRAKGFVSAGVIENGVFTEDVGGGISQFATTLFNAAFFAGLDYGEYQSHSIYISRYPYGREATLSYPHPDLEIENTTPFGVLVWTSYTSSSITVTLYSTTYVEAEQTGQRTQAHGTCTRVVTERTRTYVQTGEKKVDTVRALYRPGEGVNC